MSHKENLPKKIWDLLGSRELSIFIFITIVTYSLISYIFSLLVPQAWFETFQTLLPMATLYIAFFINLLICEIKWLPVVIRRCSRPAPPTLDDLKRFNGPVELEDLHCASSLKRTIGRRFYKVDEYDEGGNKIVHAFRGSIAPLGNIVFHLSFFFLLAGIILGLFYRFEGKAFVIEGNSFDGKRESYETLDLSTKGSLPDINFKLDSVRPEFWGNLLLFTDLKADMTLKDGSKGSAWLSEQLSIGGAGISINGLGYAFRYRLKDKDGHELASGLSRANVYMPGSEDRLTIPGYPHKFIVGYYPDARVKDGKVSNVSMNRKNPLIGLRVYRGRLPVFTGLLKEGEEVEFDSLKISFPEVKYWGDFTILKNPGFKFIWMSFTMMLAGLIWRFVFFRREVVIVDGDAGLSFYFRSDIFPKLFGKSLKEAARAS